MKAPDINDTLRTDGPDAVRARHDRAEKFNAPPKRKAEPPTRPRFNLIPFDQLKRKLTAKYLIKGLIPRSGLVVIWGPPKCGKSFWAFDATLHIALNWEYRGRRTTGGKVVYLALEGQDGFGDRAEAFRQQRFAQGRGSVPGFYLVKEKTDLIRDHVELIKCIKTQGGGAPSVVVIDTMNRSLVGSESNDEDMAAYLKAADAIREAFNCVVIVIHHCGVDERRPRGHTSQTGAADVQISVKRNAANDIITEVEYAKDMAEGAMIISRLKVVELGQDQDGDQMTSCVLEPVEETVEPMETRAKKRAAMPKAARTALRALHKAIAECGEPAPTSNHIPPNVKVTTIAKWRDYGYRSGISTSDEPRALQQAFKRASEHLIGDLHVAVWNDLVWPVKSAN